MPAIAGIQVRSGPSHHGLKVGRQERYWREHNLPVFGVVLTEPEAEPPRGGWCDAQTYLKAHPWGPLHPTPHPFPDGLAAALHAASNGAGASWPPWTSSMPTGGAKPRQWPRSCGAGSRSWVPRAAHYALYLLVVAETAGIDTAVPLAAVARAVETLYEKEIDGDVDLDAFHDGTAAAYRLLEARNADPRLVLEEALRRHAGEPTIMLIAMAVSLAGKGGQALLGGGTPPSASPAAQS